MKLAYKKRNGNGFTTCLLCKKTTWDEWCYDLYVYIIDRLICKTIICNDCFYEIKNKEKIEMLGEK